MGRILWGSADCRTNLFHRAAENSGGRLHEKFPMFKEKRTERSGKFAAGTFRRMQEKFLTVYKIDNAIARARFVAGVTGTGFRTVPIPPYKLAFPRSP